MLSAVHILWQCLKRSLPGSVCVSMVGMTAVAHGFWRSHYACKTQLLGQRRRHHRLDAGVNIGVTPAADAVNPFVGISTRF